MKLVAAAKLRRAQERILVRAAVREQDGRAARQPRERHRRRARIRSWSSARDRGGRSSSSPPTRAWRAPSTPTSSARSLAFLREPGNRRRDPGRGGPQGARLLSAAGAWRSSATCSASGTGWPTATPQELADYFMQQYLDGRGGRGRPHLQRVPLGGGAAARCASSSCPSRRRRGGSGRGAAGGGLHLRAEPRGDPRRSLLPRHVRTQVYPRADGVAGRRVRRAHDGDGVRDQERQGNDRRPDDPVQQGAPGEDHQGAARHRRRRRGMRQSKERRHEHREDRSGHRAGRGRGVRAGPAPADLQRARGAGRRQQGRLRVLREAGAGGGPAPGREPGAHGRHGRHRRPDAAAWP